MVRTCRGEGCDQPVKAGRSWGWCAEHASLTDAQKARRWALAHPDLARAANAANHANITARKYGVPGRLTRAEVLPLLSQPCHYCGRPPGGVGRSEAIGIDHVVAMANGGANVIGNVVAACGSCNKSKRTREEPQRGPHYQLTHGELAAEAFEAARWAAYGKPKDAGTAHGQDAH